MELQWFAALPHSMEVVGLSPLVSGRGPPTFSLHVFTVHALASLSNCLGNS